MINILMQGVQQKKQLEKARQIYASKIIYSPINLYKNKMVNEIKSLCQPRWIVLVFESTCLRKCLSLKMMWIVRWSKYLFLKVMWILIVWCYNGMEQCLEAHLEYKFKTICSLKAIVNSETASKNVADFYSLVMSVLLYLSFYI